STGSSSRSWYASARSRPAAAIACSRVGGVAMSGGHPVADALAFTANLARDVRRDGVEKEPGGCLQGLLDGACHPGAARVPGAGVEVPDGGVADAGELRQGADVQALVL